jgi:hypothetical protein
MIGKVGLGIAPILRPPFVEPTRGAAQIAANLATLFALQMTPNGFSSQRLFGSAGVHEASCSEAL